MWASVASACPHQKRSGLSREAVGENLEGQVEAATKPAPPLLAEILRTDDETVLRIAARDQIFDEEPRHDGLAGARIVGAQEAQLLTW